ncbi:hypothetical protein GCM10010347_43560 [Streptomyces cirratus]|uniref:CdaR GGDEF-like domain-containing protein n=1 Tax=Streptomyces cirratus TaxID=68187 RepID=A0ABQ3EWG9_9ACTN|nr:hypothetical protein GCM10010347_43560 [Streptomyces cirratus]
MRTPAHDQREYPGDRSHQPFDLLLQVGEGSLTQLIASGGPMAEDLAEGRMRYRMGCWHVGLVLWINDPQQVEAPDEAIPAVRSAAGSRSALVARACARSRWIWLSGASVPDLHGVEKALATTDEVRAAVGRPGRGLEGFRSSHQDALAAQALVIRLGSNRRLTVYADVEEVTEFDEFVPQDDGSQVVGDDPLGDLRLWRAAPRRGGAGSRDGASGLGVGEPRCTRIPCRGRGCSRGRVARGGGCLGGGSGLRSGGGGRASGAALHHLPPACFPVGDHGQDDGAVVPPGFGARPAGIGQSCMVNSPLFRPKQRPPSG